MRTPTTLARDGALARFHPIPAFGYAFGERPLGETWVKPEG